MFEESFWKKFDLMLTWRWSLFDFSPLPDALGRAESSSSGV